MRRSAGNTCRSSRATDPPRAAVAARTKSPATCGAFSFYAAMASLPRFRRKVRTRLGRGCVSALACAAHGRSTHAADQAGAGALAQAAPARRTCPGLFVFGDVGLDDAGTRQDQGFRSDRAEANRGVVAAVVPLRAGSRTGMARRVWERLRLKCTCHGAAADWGAWRSATRLPLPDASVPPFLPAARAGVHVPVWRRIAVPWRGRCR